ncbi:MAG: hypothetical protein MI685_04795 [Chlorobiales bacterium]|nr:hypothetical protein [Chlorobiales bacterium]
MTGKKSGKTKLLLAALCCIAQALFTDAAYSDDGKYKIYKARKLEAVSLREIGLFSSGVSASISPFEADVAWGSSDVDTPGLRLEEVYTTAKVSRKNVLLWYYQYNKSEDEDGMFSHGMAQRVSYRILSRSGVVNALSHKNDSSSLIMANITKKPIQCEQKNKKKIRCFGRADLDFDLSQARRSGKYFGTIEITITTL